MSIAQLEKQLLAADVAALPRHAVEISLRDSLGYIQSILDTLRTPVLILDAELRVKTASRAFYQTFGVSPDSAEGELIYDLEKGAWNIPALRQKLEQVLPQQNSFDDFEIEHHFPTLGRRSMLLNARKLWREGNHTTMILLVIEDVTESKMVEEELLRSNEDLQRFAYVAAHDLRTPLGAALSVCQILGPRIADRLTPAENRLLESAITSMKDQNALMEGILSSSIVHAGTQDNTEISLEDPLRLALSNLQGQITEAGARILYQDLPKAPGNRTQYALLFQNIIGNAIKYRRAGVAPAITLVATSDAAALHISIVDNGIGFAPEHAEKIFAPFTRLNVENTKGSGIGLATCKRIVERMKGKIWAESVLGEGTMFHITLPHPGK